MPGLKVFRTRAATGAAGVVLAFAFAAAESAAGVLGFFFCPGRSVGKLYFVVMRVWVVSFIRLFFFFGWKLVAGLFQLGIG